MKFTLTEWNAIAKAVQNELDNVTKTMETRTKLGLGNWDLFAYKLQLEDVLHKLNNSDM